MTAAAHILGLFAEHATTVVEHGDEPLPERVARAEWEAHIEAGVDRTPVEPGVEPTPGQLWAKLLDADPEERHRLLTLALEGNRAHLRCFVEGHDLLRGES